MFHLLGRSPYFYFDRNYPIMIPPSQTPRPRSPTAVLRILKSRLLRANTLVLAGCLCLLTAAPSAQAADYVLSDDLSKLPPGVTIVSPGNYSGGALTLGTGDTISIAGTKPATLTFSGAFTTGASNLINADGLASDLTLVTAGTLNLVGGTTVNANANSKGAVDLGVGSTLGGNLTTASSTPTANTTGVVNLAGNSRVSGYILTDAGAVNVADGASVGNQITTQDGVVTLKTNVVVGGGISTTAGGVNVGDGSSVGNQITTQEGVVTLTSNVVVDGGISTTAGAVNVGDGNAIGGHITTEDGVVTLKKNVVVDGHIMTIAGGINIDDGSSTCGSVISTGAGVITLTTNITVGGKINSVDGAITVGSGSKVRGDVSPSGAGVVTLTNVMVGGEVASFNGGITVTDSQVGGTVASSGAGVVVITNTTTNDPEMGESSNFSSNFTCNVDPNMDHAAYWSGTNGTNFWGDGSDTTTNWRTTADGTTAGMAPGPDTNVFITANTPTNFYATTELEKDYQIKSLTFTGTGTANTAGSIVTGNILTLNGAAGITVDVGSGANTIASDVVLGTADTNTWTNNSDNLLTVSGDVSGADKHLIVGGAGSTNFSGSLSLGSGAVNKVGTGTLSLSGTTANNFTGGLNIDEGTVNLNKTAGTNALGANSTITIGDGVGSAHTANLAILADNQMPDSTDLVLNSDGRLQMGTSEDAVSQISGTGQIDLGASGKLIIGDDNSNSTFGGSITSDDINGTLVKNGSGILELTSDISYAGTLELGGGTLKLSDIDLTVGALHITADTTIDFSGSSTFSVGDFTFANTDIVLTIINWNKTVDFFNATNWVGATQDVLDNEFNKPESQVVFSGWQANNTGWDSYDNQISPNVPEPSTYGMIFIAACSALFVAKRFRNKRSR